MNPSIRYDRPRRGDIYQTDLGGERGIRPAIIIQNDVGNKFSGDVIVVPITSRKKKPMPTHVYIPVEAGLREPGTALCETIMTIPKQRLLSWMGRVCGMPCERYIDMAIRASLQLEK